MKRKMYTMCVAKRKDNIYALCEQISYIYVINTVTEEIYRMDNMPGEEKMKENLYSGLYIESNTMLLVPRDAKFVWIYTFDDNSWDFLDISSFIDSEETYKFSGGLLKNGIAFLFGYNYHGILAIDLQTREIKNILEKNDSQGSFFGVSTVINENNIYIPMRECEKIVCINVNTLHYEIIKFENGGDCSENLNDGLAFDGNNYYLLKNHGKCLYIGSLNNGLRKVEYQSKFSSGVSYFSGIEYLSNSILFYGPSKNNFLFDVNKGEIKQYYDEPIYYAKKFIDLGVVVCKKGSIELWDYDANFIKQFITEISDDELEVYLKNSKIVNQLVNENEIVALKEFINAIYC